MNNTQLQVRKDKFVEHRLVVEPMAREVAEGEVLLQVEKFAYTANNITYAVAGDMIGYWQFFPPAGEDVEGWGVIPVWGFARVVRTSTEEIAVGERVFGYLPSANLVTVKPSRITPGTFVDGREHRARLPGVYNLYRRVEHEKEYRPTTDNERMLLFPLHLTAFCLWDYLQDNAWYGAKQVVILSASSKTATGFCYALKTDPHAPHTIGMTSDRNVATVSQLAIYDRTIAYGAVKEIDADVATVIVDMSGNTTVLAALHEHLGDNMKFTSKVGLTHWEDGQQQSGIIAERSEWFFAPDHIQKRIADWGAAEFTRRTGQFLSDTAAKTKEWLTFHTLDGLAGLAAVHVEVCKGGRPPEEGLIVELSTRGVS